VRLVRSGLLLWGLSGLGGCWGDKAYIVEGVVLEVRSPTEVVVDHERIEGLMGPMIMPFEVQDPALTANLKRGDRIVARLHLEETGAVLAKLRVTGHVPLPAPAAPSGPLPVRPGEQMPRLEIPVNGGETWVVGEGQAKPTVLTYLYTTCPFPEYCPAVVMRLTSLQQAIGTDAQIVALTIDPEGDSLERLAEFATASGARPEVWRFGRLEGEGFKRAVLLGAVPMDYDGTEIVHSLRLLVLDAQGKLIERYDDNQWPEERVVQQLRTGGPPAPPNTTGTLTPVK
jgi:protein SCO1/2